MAPRITRLATAAVLQLAALVLAHQLVYLARYGSRFGEALIHAGHGDVWSGTVTSAVLLTIGVAGIAVARLIQLGVLIGRFAPRRAVTRGDLHRGALLRAWLRLVPRMALVTLVVLSLQENIEQAAIGGPVAGPGILLSPEYAGGAWITIAVAALVSLIAALFEWRREVLLARLRAARARFARVPATVRRPLPRLAAPTISLLGRRSALRAPPVAMVPA